MASDTQNKFDEAIQTFLYSEWADNYTFLSTNEYSAWIQSLKTAEETLRVKGSKKLMKD